MSNYQPNVDPRFVLLGYLGDKADPKQVGLSGGYQTRLTDPVPQQQKQTQPNDKRRPNPYIKK